MNKTNEKAVLDLFQTINLNLPLKKITKYHQSVSNYVIKKIYKLLEKNQVDLKMIDVNTDIIKSLNVEILNSIHSDLQKIMDLLRHIYDHKISLEHFETKSHWFNETKLKIFDDVTRSEIITQLEFISGSKDFKSKKIMTNVRENFIVLITNLCKKRFRTENYITLSKDDVDDISDVRIDSYYLPTTLNIMEEKLGDRFYYFSIESIKLNLQQKLYENRRIHLNSVNVKNRLIPPAIFLLSSIFHLMIYFSNDFKLLIDNVNFFNTLWISVLIAISSSFLLVFVPYERISLRSVNNLNYFVGNLLILISIFLYIFDLSFFNLLQIGTIIIAYNGIVFYTNLIAKYATLYLRPIGLALTLIIIIVLSINHFAWAIVFAILVCVFARLMRFLNFV